MSENKKVNVVKQLRDLQTEFEAVASNAKGWKGIKTVVSSNKQRAATYADAAAKVSKAADKFETPSPIDDISALFSLQRLQEKFALNAQAVENVRSRVPFNFMLPDNMPKKLTTEGKFAVKLQNIIAQIN